MDSNAARRQAWKFALPVFDEVAQACAKHAPMNSLHEAYAVLLEEVDELWDECRKKSSERNRDDVRTELIQIAAMAFRAAIDLDYVKP